MKCFLKFSFLFQTRGFTGELELAAFSLLLLCPHRKPEVDHRPLMLGLDIGPAELGCRAYRQTLRPLVVSTSGFQQGPYLSGLQRTCLCSTGGSNPCLCLWGGRPLPSAYFHFWGFGQSLPEVVPECALIYPCAFNERGFTENSWGLLPYAQPVTTIGEWALLQAAWSEM